MMDRYTKLALFLKERADTPVEWGTHDCCMFTADAVLAQTGRDYLESFRGTYGTEVEALALMSDGGGLASMAEIAIGAPPMPNVTTARRGDVILFDSGQGPAMGVCVGEKFAAVPPDGGVSYYSMRHALLAWRIE